MRLSLVESVIWLLSSNLRICNLQVGVACALGGARLDAAGCASVRLATHTCDADGLGAIRDALANGELVQGASLIPRELATPSESAPPHPMCASDPTQTYSYLHLSEPLSLIPITELVISHQAPVPPQGGGIRTVLERRYRRCDHARTRI